MKIGVVDVGGGMRGIYAAGIFDYCLDNQINFDLCIGVSAGSANLASFLAKQRGRNYKFYTEYAFRKEYMSFENFLNNHNYVNLDYVYDTLSSDEGEAPIDFATLDANPAEFVIVATEAKTAKTTYFDRHDFSKDNYDVFKASSDIPYVCRPYMINGVEYFDGGVANPVPFEKAFEMGCDYVIVILTKPEDTIRNSRKDSVIATLIKKDYPALAECLNNRAVNYNASVAKLKHYRDQGKVLIVAPDDTCGVDTLEKEKSALTKLYVKGYYDGIKIKEFLNKIKTEA